MQRKILMAAVVGVVCGGAWAEGEAWFTSGEGQTWDVEFSGGSVADFYSGLNEGLSGENIVVHPAAAQVAMPSISLDNVAAEAAIMLPRQLLSGVSVERNPGKWFGEDEPMSEEFWIVQVNTNDVTSWMPSQIPSAQQSGYDISFPGGTVAQYINAVRAVADGGMNVVMMPGVEGIVVPEISLKGVYAPQALAVLNELRRPDGQAWAKVGEVAANVYVLRPASDERHEITREVWNLSELMSSGIGEDGILRAVEMGLGSVGDGAEVLYHEDTGLLLVVGSHDHVHVVEEILSEMHETAVVREHARMLDEQRVREQEELELDIHRNRAELELLQEQVSMQKDAIHELIELEKQELVPSHEVRHSQMTLREYESELHIKVRELQILERRMKALGSGSGGGGGRGA